MAFLPSVQPQMSCTTVNATNDDRLEEPEVLIFTLEGSDEVVIGLTSITTLTITDETGEHRNTSDLCLFLSQL